MPSNAAFCFCSVVVSAVLLCADAILLKGSHLGTSSDQVHQRELGPRRTVRKPLMDDREYTEATFDSGLRVLAVNDPGAEKSAFAVAVEAGSLEDPEDFQGLAHFCEHMLFLGSEKYPNHNAFSEYLALHGGQHNAYTSAEMTVYFNQIGNEGVAKGLDIFAQFFIAPSFDEKMVDKEINAVDSEHMKYKPDAQRRQWHLLWSKANPKNPAHKFSTGNLKTLKTDPESQGKSLVDALKKFHDENYCARRMHLVMIMNKTSEEQLELAHQAFDTMPRATPESCPARPTYVDKAQFSSEVGNIRRLWTLPTTGAPQMMLVFPMPDLRSQYKAQAQAPIWHALGHYGPGGLKALLQEEDLSNSYSYSEFVTAAGSSILMTFSLTEKGVQHHEDVLKYLFAYLNVVRKAGVSESGLANLRQLRQVTFDYQEKNTNEFDFVTNIASALLRYETQDLLSGGHLIDEPNATITRDILDNLSPDNMNVVLMKQGLNESLATDHEPYYDFGYNDTALSDDLRASLRSAMDDRLTPPPDLAFVPRKLDIIKEGAGEDGPEALVEQGRVQTWWLGMGAAKLPKAIIQLKIGFSREIIDSVETAILTGLHTRIINRVLEKPSDALQMCGLSYSTSAGTDGLGVTFSGFDEHIQELVKLVLPAVRKPEYTPEDFEMLRRQLLSDLSDNTKKEPYQHALEAFELVTVKGRYGRNEVLETAANPELLSPRTHADFLEKMFGKAEIKLLFTGNIGRERAQTITSSVESLLHVSREQAKVELNSNTEILKPKEELEVRIPNPISGDPNSATVVVYQFGVPTIANRIHLTLLDRIINRPIFNTLRTKYQLGYTVFGHVALHGPIAEFRVLVQGFRKDPDTVEGLIENTVQNITSMIASLSKDEFEVRKQTLRVALTEKVATLSGYAGQYWGHIWEGTHCFQKKKLMLQYLNSDSFSSPEALLRVWTQAVAPGDDRKRVVVKLFGRDAAQHAGGASLIGGESNSTKAKVLTLMDSASVRKELKGEGFWPDQYICK